jgi:tetratricopeptide (TPR) repeat protein
MFAVPVTRRSPATLAALLLALGIGAPAASRAAGTPPPPPRETPEASAPASTEEPDTAAAAALVRQARADAEKQYRDGYALAQEADKTLASGKGDDAKKKFGKALKKFDRATELDSKYYEAWNMVGYCSRQTGDLKRAFAAYDKCLQLAPDYEEAHEYLGEAYLKMGDLAKAKEQLAWLQARKSKEADELEEKIARAEGKAPASTSSGESSWGSPAPAAGHGGAGDSAAAH